MQTESSTAQVQKTLDRVTVRFAGDSGDGMQLTGARFTQETARAGNDLATQPDFPAEIRAPAGTVAGVSAYQIQFGGDQIFTAGDYADVLIAMNPAALKANLKELRQNGILICNTDAFTDRNLSRVGYAASPLEDEKLKTKYHTIGVAITTLTHEALKDLGLSKSAVDKCKNFFALGIVVWLFSRGLDETVAWIEKRFGKETVLTQANITALRAGMAFAEASEGFSERYQVPPAQLAPGLYRDVTGNQALVFGLLAASQLNDLPLYYSGYPITPASDILHELAKLKNFGVCTVQAEDEIAACCSAVGASYAGCLGVTGSSGPGIILKQEAIALAVMTELPLVIINVQRAGPSTGMPTKTEQADLLEVMYGRNGECPVVVLAVASPQDAFDAAYEAARIAIEHMVPVVLLSDGSIGTGSAPWKIPELSSLPRFTPRRLEKLNGHFAPYDRDPDTLVRNWVLPGTAGLEHRIGGIEKQDVTGNISYDPENHERMVKLRAEKVGRVAQKLPPTQVNGAPSGDLLVVSWGSTWGAVSQAVNSARKEGCDVSHVHLRHLNPLPKDLGDILKRFSKVLVPELNMGQLKMVLRDRYLIDIQGLSKVQGQQFKVEEIVRAIEEGCDE